MVHGSVFSGIGGFDLAAERLGWENAFHCDVNAFCRKFLDERFRGKGYGDIKRTSFREWRGKIDVLSGGFPCQDASIAKQDGKGQQGLAGERTSLWWEMARVIKEIEPKFVVIENVGNILRTNEGKDFGEILRSLSGMGYDAEWKVLYASDVGAPHHRKRCYLVAYSHGFELQTGQSFYAHVRQEVKPKLRMFAGTTVSTGLPWENEPSVCSLDYGFPHWAFGYNAKTKLVKEFFQAYGNAVVPEIAYRIFQAIQEFVSVGCVKKLSLLIREERKAA